MKKKLERIQAIVVRMNEMKDLCVAEKREMSNDERREFEELRIERSQIQMDIEAGKPIPGEVSGPKVLSRAEAFNKFVFEAAEKGRTITGAPLMKREDTTNVPTTDPDPVVTSLTEGANVIPLTVGDIIEPLEKGLILNKIGLKVETGLSGTYNLPIVASVEAQIAGVDAALSDKNITITKLTPSPKRVGIKFPVNDFANWQSRGRLWEIVLKQGTLAIQRTLNKWMFQETAIAEGCNGVFTGLGASQKVTFAKKIPSYAELIDMQGSVYKNGIIADGTQAYIMGAAMYAKLQTKPIDAGSGLFVIQDGKIGGVPVFVTEYVGEKIGFGVFSYMAFGQFGDVKIGVDPITNMDKDQVLFVINSYWSMTRLRDEAFMLGTCGTTD